MGILAEFLAIKQRSARRIVGKYWPLNPLCAACRLPY